MISLMTSGGVALWVAVLTTPFLIRWLLKNNIGQQIREDGPQVHIAKAGTPTMGGICIVGAVVVGFLAAHIIPGVTFSPSGVLVMGAIVGAAAIVAGVLYLTQPVHSLPTFFPGYAAHAVAKHTKRGYAGIALGAVLVIIGFVVAFSGSRRRALH